MIPILVRMMEHFRTHTKFRDTQLMLTWFCYVCSLRAISTFLAFVAFVALGANADCNPAHQPPPTLASPIQGDFLSKHTSAADCECELGIGWRGIWGDLADCAQASLFSRKSTRFKFPGPLMLLHPLICGHTKGNFISEGLNRTWKQTISSECSSPLVSIKSSTSGGQAHTTPTTVWTAILSSNITCYLPLSFYVLQYLFLFQILFYRTQVWSLSVMFCKPNWSYTRYEKVVT